VIEESNMENILRSNYIIDEFDHDLTRHIADILCSPERLMVMMRSKSFEKECTITEKWFNTKYIVNDLPDDLRKRILSPNVPIKNKILDMPPKNNLIAKNFDILERNVDYSKRSQLIKNWPGTHLWYKKDDKFGVPKAIVSMRIFTKYVDSLDYCESAVFISCWLKVLNEYLREFKYMAEIA
jgi:insulysin